MAQSQNSSVDLTIPATSFAGLGTYGKMMIGNKAVEFYNDRNVEDYIQIPWTEVDHIAAEVLGGGRMIARFAVFTRDGNHFSFSTRDNKKTLRAMLPYVPAERMVRSVSFLGVIKAGFIGIGHLVAGLFRRDKGEGDTGE